jgi:hypothetical protein
VEIYAYACRIAPGRIEIAHPLPVHLESSAASPSH